MSSALQVLNENNKVSEWAERITECRNSGLSVREWCEANVTTSLVQLLFSCSVSDSTIVPRSSVICNFTLLFSSVLT